MRRFRHQMARRIASIRAVQITILGIAAALAVGLIAIQPDYDPAQVEAGRQVYAENCAACHGADGEGANPDNPREPGPNGLYGAPPHNDTGHTWHHSDPLLTAVIRNGSTTPGFETMPAFGDKLSDDEIAAVIAFIKTLWTDEQREFQREVVDEIIWQ